MQPDGRSTEAGERGRPPAIRTDGQPADPSGPSDPGDVARQQLRSYLVGAAVLPADRKAVLAAGAREVGITLRQSRDQLLERVRLAKATIAAETTGRAGGPGRTVESGKL
jgi:hypothetical protein